MKLTGGEIVREYLIKEKVPYFVGIPGHGCLGLVDAFKGSEDKIKILRKHREEQYTKLQDAVYIERGWNTNGCPTIATVKRLGIDFHKIIDIITPYQ